MKLLLLSAFIATGISSAIPDSDSFANLRTIKLKL